MSNFGTNSDGLTGHFMSNRHMPDGQRIDMLKQKAAEVDGWGDFAGTFQPKKRWRSPEEMLRQSCRFLEERYAPVPEKHFVVRLSCAVKALLYDGKFKLRP